MKSYTVLLMIIICQSFYAQNWEWGKKLGSNSQDNANGIATDANGNNIVVGSFNSYMINIGSSSLINNGFEDIFISKSDNLGNPVWSKTIGGSKYDSAQCVTVDSVGNIYVSGVFTNRLDFGSGIFLFQSGNINTMDIFVAKYDPMGNILWAKKIGGPQSDYSTAIKVDSNNNIVLTGYFYSSYLSYFDSFGDSNMWSATNTADAFLVKFNSTGGVIWHQTIAGTKNEITSSLSIDNDNNISLSGTFNSPSILIGPSSSVLYNYDGGTATTDMFILQIDSTGVLIWNKKFGGQGNDYVNALACDNIGNVYIIGASGNTTITFDSFSLINSNIFIAKLDLFGNALWANNIAGQKLDSATSITSDLNGNVTVVGNFRSSALNFGTNNTLVNSSNTSNDNDIFIAKYNGSGQVIWVKQVAGDFDEQSNFITSNTNGDLFLIGTYDSSRVDFGINIFVNNVLPHSMFIAKYSGVDGGVMWARSFGCKDDTETRVIKTDAVGNIYAGGYFGSPSLYYSGGSSIGSSNTTPYRNSFLLKYDINGILQWARDVSGGYNEIESLSIDQNSNSYVVGHYRSPNISFKSFNLLNNSTTGTSDLFITKYDTNGNVVWAKTGGGSNDDKAKSLVSDANGNIYVTGTFTSPTIVFGPITLTNSSLNHTDIFLVKYNTVGNLLWAKRFGGALDDSAKSITLDNSGNIILTGSYDSSSIQFGPSNFLNSSPGTEDIFISKFDSLGNVLWAKSAGGSNSDIANGIATDSLDNIVITGNFFSPVLNFETTNLLNSNLAFSDIFVTKYNSTGNVLWSKSFGGNDNDISNSVDVDNNSNIIITGNFKSDVINFDSITYNNVGHEDIFMTKLDPSGNVLIAKHAGGNSSDFSNAVTHDLNNNIIIGGSIASSNINFDSILFQNRGGLDMFFVKLGNSLGIDEVRVGELAYAYPNPNKGIFTLNTEEDIVSIEIFDLLGKSVYWKKNILNIVNIENLSDGIYILKAVTSDKKEFLTKIIKN